MAKKIDVKLIVNKSNGQMNFSLPKKKISKETLANIMRSKKMRIEIDKLYDEVNI